MITRLLTATSLALAAVGGARAAERPNIVLFVLDDLNDWVGPLGYRQAITPNMDRLAASGMTFTNAHTAGIFCAPSRTAFFTGRYAFSTGCYTTQVYHRDHPDIRPLQQVLQDSGYATYGAGKLFHHPAGFIDLRGWNEFFVRDPRQKTRGGGRKRPMTLCGGRRILARLAAASRSPGFPLRMRPRSGRRVNRQRLPPSRPA